LHKDESRSMWIGLILLTVIILGVIFFGCEPASATEPTSKPSNDGEVGLFLSSGVVCWAVAIAATLGAIAYINMKKHSDD
jgi:drug/metabolite transporter (DMT)-like permease